MLAATEADASSKRGEPVLECGREAVQLCHIESPSVKATRPEAPFAPRSTTGRGFVSDRSGAIPPGLHPRTSPGRVWGRRSRGSQGPVQLLNYEANATFTILEARIVGQGAITELGPTRCDGRLEPGVRRPLAHRKSGRRPEAVVARCTSTTNTESLAAISICTASWSAIKARGVCETKVSTYTRYRRTEIERTRRRLRRTCVRDHRQRVPLAVSRSPSV